MRSKKAKSINQYLTGVSTDKRAALQKLREAIHAAAPGVKECISYGMPGFRFEGRMLAWFAAAANHCSFYPGGLVQDFKTELKNYDTSKGTIRFPADRPLPVALVRKLVKAKIAVLRDKETGGTRK